MSNEMTPRDQALAARKGARVLVGLPSEARAAAPAPTAAAGGQSGGALVSEDGEIVRLRRWSFTEAKFVMAM